MISIMKQCVFPMLLFMIIQIPVFFVGCNLNNKSEWQEWNSQTVLKTYICGQVVLWAFLQLIAVPMILCRVRFQPLFVVFLIAAVLLFVLGCWRFRHFPKSRNMSIRKWFFSLSPVIRIVFLAALALILFQVLTYFLGQHIDQDDARWLAEANDALVYGDLMTRSASTGELIGTFDTARDVTSPWPVFYAVMAKMIHSDTAVAAHTVYAPVALLLSYGTYWLLAGELFESADARVTFLFSVALINLFFAGTTYTQAVFTLVRIWQGKASVAGIIIPFLIYLFISINKRNNKSDWILVILTSFAACLMSGMGISLGGIICLIFGGYSIIAYRIWNRIPFWLLSLAPAIGYFSVFFCIRG